MSKPTPGPWRVVEHNWSDTSVYADKQWVAGLSCGGAFEELDCDEQVGPKGDAITALMAANARLIAAAPDLLQALKDFVSNYDNSEGDEQSCARAARAAIAKAEGTS